MKFLVCKKQEGEGCDYTIGCGMCFSFIEASSIEEAQEKTIWPDGREESSSLEGDTALEEILIIPAEFVVSIDVDELKKEINDIKKKQVIAENEARERAELQRLQTKYSI